MAVASRNTSANLRQCHVEIQLQPNMFISLHARINETLYRKNKVLGLRLDFNIIASAVSEHEQRFKKT